MGGSEGIKDLEARLVALDQAALVPIVRGLSAAAVARLQAELERLDLPGLLRAWRACGEGAPTPAAGLAPATALAPSAAEAAHLAARGRAALAQGRVAVLTVAGGDGTRLGHDAPKGCYPIAPVSGASLYRLFAAAIVRARRTFAPSLPWVLLTSPATDAATRAHLGAMAWLARQDDPGFTTLVQRRLPVIGAGGTLLVGPDGCLAMAPDGHGGALAALASSGTLARLADQGVDILYYHQVDNPFGRHPDPVLIGLHLEHRAEMTAKVVEKTDPDERVGVLAERDGACVVVEYSELPPALAAARRPDGRLTYAAGSIAVHTFALEFLTRAAREPLPLHRARKRVPHLGAGGVLVNPEAPNADKLESFIFDLLPRARRTAALQVSRRLEFHPLKDATGVYSPAEVRAALSRTWAEWLERRGLMPRPAARVVEISPLVALDADDLDPATKVDVTSDGAILLAPPDW